MATAANSYETRLAKKYYDKLFNGSILCSFLHVLFVEERLRKDYSLLLEEYCICELSRYKKNHIGVRWRIDTEVSISIFLVAYAIRLSSVVPSMLEKILNKFKTHVELFSTSRSSPSIAWKDKHCVLLLIVFFSCRWSRARASSCAARSSAQCETGWRAGRCVIL